MLSMVTSIRHQQCMVCWVQSKLIQTVAANYVLWPFAHFVNFRFIPNEHRILYNNVVSVRPHSLRAVCFSIFACTWPAWCLATAAGGTDVCPGCR